MTQKLFLSYKREDNKDGFVEKLYNALTDKGYDVWWDMQSMPGNQPFLVEIRNAIDEHERLILVGSKAAYESDYVKVEYEYALSPGICKPVHTIIRADEYSDMPPGIAQVDAPNFKDDANFDTAFAHLLRHLEDDIAPLGTIHGTRPALPAWYIERDNIMGELDNMVLIDSKQPVVVTSKKQVNALHGMGGIGKTTVANAFSERCTTRRYFPDGVFWLTLGKNPDITFQQSNIGKIFGDDPKEYLSPEKGLARLQALLSDKKVLFVLDDVWEKDHADAFRIQGNFTRTLITSRQQDLVTQIAAMSAEVDKLTPEEGLRLFDARLIDDDNNPRLPENRKHEATETRIIKLLDGYTLAVELASAQLAKKGEDYAERLLDRLQKKRATDNPFSDLEIEGDGKNDNLEISLAISYEDLSADEQRRFRVLGVLAPNAPFSYELMQPLYGDEDDSVTEDNLDVIQNMALISLGEVGSYTQHSLLRDYAQALLKRENEYKEYYYSYLEHITDSTQPFDAFPLEEWVRFDDIIPHILYVGDSLTIQYGINETLHPLAMKFAFYTTNYIYRRPEIHRQNWVEMGLLLSELHNVPSQFQALFLNQLGLVHSNQSNYQQALKLLNSALALLQQIDFKSQEASTLNNIGFVYNNLGDKEQPLIYFNQALSIFQQLDDKGNQANTLNNIGSFYNDIGDSQNTINFCQQALDLFKGSGDRSGEAKSLNNIGMAHSHLGDKQRGLTFYRQALPLYREVSDKGGEGTVSNNMGMNYADLENMEMALTLYEQSLALFQEVGNKHKKASTLRNMGEVYIRLKNAPKALTLYKQALFLFQEVSDTLNSSKTMNDLGMVYDTLGDLQQSLDFYIKSLNLAQQIADTDGEMTILNNIGEVLDKRGEKQQALTFYKQSLLLIQKTHYIDRAAYMNYRIGATHSALGDMQEAYMYYSQALDLFHHIGDTYIEVTILFNIGVIQYKRKYLDEAIGYVFKSVELAREIRHPDAEVYITYLINWQQERDHKN